MTQPDTAHIEQEYVSRTRAVHLETSVHRHNQQLDTVVEHIFVGLENSQFVVDDLVAVNVATEQTSVIPAKKKECSVRLIGIRFVHQRCFQRAMDPP